MTTAAGTESWKGFTFEEVHTDNGTPADSGRLFLAYRDGGCAHAACDGAAREWLVRGHGSDDE